MGSGSTQKGLLMSAKKGFYVKMDKKVLFKVQKMEEKDARGRKRPKVPQKGMIPVKDRHYQYQLMAPGLSLD